MMSQVGNAPLAYPYLMAVSTIAAARANYPALERWTYMDLAGRGVLSRGVRAAVDAQLDERRAVEGEGAGDRAGDLVVALHRLAVGDEEGSNELLRGGEVSFAEESGRLDDLGVHGTQPRNMLGRHRPVRLLARHFVQALEHAPRGRQRGIDPAALRIGQSGLAFGALRTQSGHVSRQQVRSTCRGIASPISTHSCRPLAWYLALRSGSELRTTGGCTSYSGW